MIDPVKNATADTTDFTSKTAYDFDHRTDQITDAAGNVTKTGYDKDGLKTTGTDADNNTTTTSYDERGKVSQVKAPYQGSAGSPTYRTTTYQYDQAGNQTQVITPRANAAGSSTAFVRRTTFDELNRPSRQYQPYNPADATYNDANVYTETDYDAAGRVAKTSAPPSNGQSVRNDTAYTYYDDGQARTSTDPWAITTSYDYNELGQQTARTLTSAGGSSRRTMGWSFFPDGSLASRTDDGTPVGLQVALADNSDSQSTSSTGTWATASTGDPATEQGYDYRTHAAGSGTDAFSWQLDVPQDGTYTVYAKYPRCRALRRQRRTPSRTAPPAPPSRSARPPAPTPGSPSGPTRSARARPRASVSRRAAPARSSPTRSSWSATTAPTPTTRSTPSPTPTTPTAI